MCQWSCVCFLMLPYQILKTPVLKTLLSLCLSCTQKSAQLSSFSAQSLRRRKASANLLPTPPHALLPPYPPPPPPPRGLWGWVHFQPDSGCGQNSVLCVCGMKVLMSLPAPSQEHPHPRLSSRSLPGILVHSPLHLRPATAHGVPTPLHLSPPHLHDYAWETFSTLKGVQH